MMKDETELEDELTSTWQVIGVAVQGVSHQKQGIPCQDALDYAVLPNGSLLVALADGAGSAVHADRGARCAVDAALESLIAGLEEDPNQDGDALAELLRRAFHSARDSLEGLAGEEQQDLRDYATTLTCAAILPGRLAIGQLGDGAVVIGDLEGNYSTATRAQRGEYANETYFLSQEQALDRVEVQVIDRPIQALAAMSDGLTRLALKMPSYEPHIPFFQPLFDFVVEALLLNSNGNAGEQMAAFLASERVSARTDDDKALVLAVRPIGTEGSTTDSQPPAEAVDLNI
jgi:serine/threonine protein phosphatase PrpC